jgi:membrane associated rhomboid family serine protease
MFSLWMFGVIIERSLGSQKYLIYYISCGLGAALLQEGIFALMINHYAGLFENGNAICNVMRNSQFSFGQLFDLNVSPYDGAIISLFHLYHNSTVGASGAIYGILLAFGFLFPQMRIYLIFPPMPLRARTAVILFAAIELMLGIYNSQADTIAHFTHLGGMLVGLLILIWWKKNGIIRPFF